MTFLAFHLVSLIVTGTDSRFLFGDAATGWVVVDGEGAVQRRLRKIGGIEPTDATISRDGRRWAVVVAAAERDRPQLRLLDAAEGPWRTVESKGNVLDGVAFSDDSEWVYFSANDENQPRFDNQPMKYAQIYRVRFITGGVERLSMVKGCQMWPRPKGRDIVVSHSNCAGGGRALEIVTHARRRILIPDAAAVGEAAANGSQTKVFYFVTEGTVTELRTWDLSSGASQKWGAVLIESMRTRPQWVGDAVLFQNKQRLWVVSDLREPTEVARLGGEL
ncbi:MAG: hypothetical protein Q8K32_35080 [Archangium sp.]|nr:hypothetical protein [Archangium sp.]